MIDASDVMVALGHKQTPDSVNTLGPRWAQLDVDAQVAQVVGGKGDSISIPASYQAGVTVFMQSNNRHAPPPAWTYAHTHTIGRICEHILTCACVDMCIRTRTHRAGVEALLSADAIQAADASSSSAPPPAEKVDAAVLG